MGKECNRQAVFEEQGESDAPVSHGVIRRHLVLYFRTRYPGWDEVKVRREVAYAMGSEGIVGFLEGLEKLDDEMVRKNPDWDWYLRWFELVPPAPPEAS